MALHERHYGVQDMDMTKRYEWQRSFPKRNRDCVPPANSSGRYCVPSSFVLATMFLMCMQFVCNTGESREVVAKVDKPEEEIPWPSIGNRGFLQWGCSNSTMWGEALDGAADAWKWQDGRMKKYCTGERLGQYPIDFFFLDNDWYIAHIPGATALKELRTWRELKRWSTKRGHH
jgi:hypothetical protein